MMNPNKPSESVSSSMPNWSVLHGGDESWRKKIVGDISEMFVIPRYVEFFGSHFGKASNLTFLELGSGTADISQAITRKYKRPNGPIKAYVLSEQFPEGVAWLREKGLEVLELDACALALADSSYDVTVSLDVMHHVANPRSMACEMMRVARGKCLLVESNGLSVFRKLKELTPAHRQAGEKSFTPWQWRGFFEGHPGYKISRFELFPFLFPFKVPSRFLGVLVAFNRIVEKIPFFRWQCSSVAIFVEYQRV
jgi:SAM-dependent methyltransferase